MSETYHDIPEETLHDVMWEIAREREQSELIDARELRRHLAKLVGRASDVSVSYMSRGRTHVSAKLEYRDVIALIDEMQSEARR